MFDVLESPLNEYGEIIMQHFTSSDNRRQLKIVLCMLKSCGLIPSFALFDVLDQYCHLLDRIFTSHKTYLEYNEPYDQNPSSLPILPITGSIICPNSIEIIILDIEIIDDYLNDNSNIKNMVVSIYFESPIQDFRRVKGKISVIQIVANMSNYKRHLLVLPFVCHTNNRKFLIWIQLFLAQGDVLFIGMIIANYISKLTKYY